MRTSNRLSRCFALTIKPMELGYAGFGIRCAETIMISMLNNTMNNFAVRQMNIHYAAWGKSSMKLASGSRLYSASEDPAGMAVYSYMRGEMTSLRQRIRNADDGISLLQDTDSKLASIGEVLVQMERLAEQAATGTYSKSQKRIMAAEFKQLSEELNFIKGLKSFNGINLTGNDSLPVTINTDGESGFDLGEFRVPDAGLGDADLINDPDAALEMVRGQITSNSESRGNAGAKANRLELQSDNLQNQLFNVQEAASRIADVDVAEEITENIKQKVLSEAATAMAAQSNDIQKDMILKLLETDVA